ncbi:MAG: hypothetical protein ABIP48_24605, partial [Planctomycetota bacterium]
HTRSTGASSLLPDGRNSKKATGFGASMNREEAPVLPWGEAEVRFRRMNRKKARSRLGSSPTKNPVFS